MTADLKKQRTILRRQLLEMGMTPEAADEALEDFFSGRVKKGRGWGGQHPPDVAALCERAFFTQGLRRIVLEVALSGDDYHLNTTVLEAESDVDIAARKEGAN